MVDWEAERQRAARIREQELWFASPEGRAATAPFENITRLEAGNAKLLRKIEKRQARGL